MAKGHAITSVHMTGDEAKAIRQRLGWTLERTASEMGVVGGRVNYWQFEHGIRRFTFAQAELLRAYAAGYRRKEARSPAQRERHRRRYKMRQVKKTTEERHG